MTNEEKAGAMKDWARHWRDKLPQEIQLTAYEKIIDTAGFVDCQLNLMEASKIGERQFNLAYYAIYQLRRWTVEHKEEL